MSKPLAFASSASHAGIQLADLLAGVAPAVPGAGLEATELGRRIEGHFHEDCILPDFSAIDLDGDEAPVNWLVLEELASRADNGEDPLDGVEMVFAYAKSTVSDFILPSDFTGAARTRRERRLCNVHRQ